MSVINAHKNCKQLNRFNLIHSLQLDTNDNNDYCISVLFISLLPFFSLCKVYHFPVKMMILFVVVVVVLHCIYGFLMIMLMMMTMVMSFQFGSRSILGLFDLALSAAFSLVCSRFLTGAFLFYIENKNRRKYDITEIRTQ